MKKTLLRRGAVIAACAAAFVLVSCGETEFDGRQDTVYELDTPDVRAVAYPGVNFVSWEPVAGVSNYTLRVYEEGAFKKEIDSAELTGNSYADSKLTNGKTYTYYVEAKSASNPAGPAAKAVYALNSIGQASVEAIVPPAGTKALDLAAYEDGYDGETKTVSESDEWIVKPSNIKVAVVDGTVQVNFPMKAYLKYDVKYYNNDLPHEAIINTDVKSGSTNEADANANNVLGRATFNIESAGKFQIAVIAKSYDNFYKDSDEVLYGELITIDALKLDTVDNKATTSTKFAYYLYGDNKIADDAGVTGANKAVRISFEPAKKDGVKVPTKWYKVYRRVEGEYTNTPLAAVKEDVAKNYYYVDDTVPDVTKKYVYTIAVTDGKKYGISVEDILSYSLDGIGFTEVTLNETRIDWSNANKTSTFKVSSTGDAIKATLTAYYWSKPADWENDKTTADKTLYDDIIGNGKKAELSLSDDSTDREEKIHHLTVPTVTGDVYLLVVAKLQGYNTQYVLKTVNIPKYE